MPSLTYLYLKELCSLSWELEIREIIKALHKNRELELIFA